MHLANHEMVNEEKKWSKQKAQTSRDAWPTVLPIPKSWVMGNVGSWKFTFSLVTYLQYAHAKFHPNWTAFGVKELARRKVAETKAQISWDAPPTPLPIKKSWAKGNVGSWDSACSLVKYLHYVSAEFHPSRTTFSVKRLVRKKVVKAKSSNFTR